MPLSTSDALIAWYRKNRRDLPWRGSDDPYAVLVSEVMLQQTRVSAVVPYYRRFMHQFPTADALASAGEDEALAAWEGLGYYRRLRSLRSAARVVAESGWPDDLRTLPGVGRYTAAAVGSIALGRQEACADGNVKRVWSRYLGRALTEGEAEEQSAKMMAGHTAGEWNQAVMELGATVCTPKSPRCGDCPLGAECVVRRSGADALLPKKAERVVRLEQVCVCPVRAGRVVGVRRAGLGEWWEGMYTFVRGSVLDDLPGDTAAKLGLRQPRHLGSLSHVVTHHRIRLHAYVGAPAGGMKVEWRHIDELRRLPMPKPDRRVMQWLEAAA